MRKIGLIGLILTVILCVSNAYAASVDIPYCLKAMTPDKSSDSKISVCAEYDSVAEHRMKSNNKTEAKGTFSNLKWIYSTDYAIDFYAMFGYANGLEYGNASMKFDLEDDWAWGLGTNMVIFIDELEDLGMWPFFDFKYRKIDNIDYKSITAGGITYEKGELSRISAAKWAEWQLALGMIKNLDPCVFYFGLKYCDAQVSAKATAGGTVREISKTKGQNLVGIFLGIEIPTEKIKVGIETRFIDEKAISVKATYKF
ncbi:MAG: hypothetical protein GY853_04765 [PVC group bacterium]|nr:hypothetical protein [PVC group bacterium]